MSEQKLQAGITAPDPELFKLMADSVTDYAIFLLDASGGIASWNPGAQKIKGYRPEEVIGRHFSVFYTPEDVARDWPAYELNEAARTGRFEDEGWRVKKDGSRFWANVIITALKSPSGAILAFSKITRDLSERKAAEERIRQSEERFRLLVEGVQDYAIYMLDTNGIVTSWNSGAQQITGYTADEIIGKHISTFYAGEDARSGKPEAELATARMHGRAEDEAYRVRKNGTRFWARVIVTTLTDEYGNLRGFAKVTQDLTQRKHAEALESASNNINQFIAVLAHELRNPLAPIRSAANLLKMDPALGAENTQIVQIIDRQSGQLIRIVDDLIDVSRITRGKLSIERKEVSVMEIITRSVEAARPGIDAMHHTLYTDLDGAPSTVMGDEVRLSQALTNLLNNAARYTEPGGNITLKVATDRANRGSELVISVKDTGRGIAPELHNSIFGMFVQGEDKRNITSGAGLGVGLALARSIAELHQGTLSLESAGVGKGSEFILRLPLSQTPPARSTDVNPAQATESDKLCILIVDDNADVPLLVGAFYKKLGHGVLTANSGKEALELFDRHRPELVLLDIGMPSMNGYELARHIRRHPYGKGTHLVAITGWGKDEDRYRSKEAGIDLHLVKPVENEDLLAVLNTPGLRAAKR